MTEILTIRIPPELKAVLQSLADSDRRKLSSYIMLVLEKHAEKAAKARTKQ